MPAIDGWIPISEAAEILGVTVQRVHQLIAEYEVSTYTMNSRYKLVREQDIEKIASMERPTGVHKNRREK